MNERITCGHTRDMLPDLALGLLSGDDRALVLNHLGGCATCEAEANDLAAAVDALLLLTPQLDPPAGFESAVLARVDAAGSPSSILPRWRRPRVVLGAMAAAAVIVVATAGTTYATREHDPAIDEQVVHSIQALGGKELRAAPLAAHGISWGQAFVYEGRTSWVFVSMSWDVPDGDYHVVLDRSDGPSATVARLHLVRGQGSTGMSVGDTRTVTAVRVVDPIGRTVCTATMPAQA